MGREFDASSGSIELPERTQQTGLLVVALGVGWVLREGPLDDDEALFVLAAPLVLDGVAARSNVGA